MTDAIVTAIGTPNIALIKYWGKRDEKLILPTNSSVSITLDEQLNTKTSVLFSDKLKTDRLYINGELQDINNGEAHERFGVVDQLRKLAKINQKVLIVSHNSFPTAGGLASSASGMATLVFAGAKALGLKLSQKELSIIARMGSGSACRSILGGIVEWRKGDKSDGSDSYAEQIVDEKYWPELIDIIAVVVESKKKIGSRAGMKQTVSNSVLYKSRMEYVESAVEKLRDAIKKRDFAALAEITMRDSNSMHAVMLDTWPPIMYLNDTSKQIISVVHELNQTNGSPIAAYTFDAGPNAQLITLSKNKGKVMDAIKDIVGDGKIIVAGQGSGPRLLSGKDSLIDSEKLAPLAK